MGKSIEAFAEQILLSEKLEGKLLAFQDFDGNGRGLVLNGTLETPRRSPEIAFSRQEENRAFPSVRSLSSDKQQAQILHAFANHELLAIELMAYAVLRFPEAPESFRRGILHTISDEQRHFSLYLSRIRELGYDFGEFPLNGFFWRQMKGISTPLEYLTQMSLTFEQANLDYCRYFMNLFRCEGDTKTADILQKVYLDEISHVHFGVRWFEKIEGRPLDFTTFQNNLSWPMSPVWAKGRVFDLKGRLESGLSQEFCDDLFLFHRTRGRAPDIFLFYPEAEENCLRSKPKTTQSRQQRGMRSDLELLPYFLAKRDDTVLVRRRPGRRHLKRLEAYGCSGIEIVEGFDEQWRGEIPDQQHRKFASLQPWGWDAFIGQKFDHLYFAENPPGVENFRQWNSKVRLAEQMRSMKMTDVALADVSITIENSEELEWALSQLPDAKSYVIKNEYGYSGLGLRVFGRDAADRKGITEAILSKGGRALLEPWYEKVFDYSVQIDIDRDGGVSVKGLARFLTDSRGRYRGARLGRFDTGLSAEETRFVHAYPVTQVFEKEIQSIGQELYRNDYWGPAGIDCLVCRDSAGQLKHRFALEVNPRWNMGRLAVQLQKKLSPGKTGLWRILHYREIENFRSWSEWAERVESRLSPQFKRDFWAGGVFLLTDPELAQNCLGLVLVADSVSELENSTKLIF